MKKFGNKAKILNDYVSSNTNIEETNKNNFYDKTAYSNKKQISPFSKSNYEFICDSKQINKNPIDFTQMLIEEENFEFKKSSKRILISEKNCSSKVKLNNENINNYLNNNNISINNCNCDFFQTKNISNNKEKEYEILKKAKQSSKIKQYDLDELHKSNLYSILNVKENATKEQIKKSYRDLSKIYHPDKGGCPEDFLNLNKAYKILMNDNCRNLYDQFSVESFNMIEIILKENE